MNIEDDHCKTESITVGSFDVYKVILETKIVVKREEGKKKIISHRSNDAYATEGNEFSSRTARAFE